MQRRAVLDHGEVPPVAGDQQVGRRRERCADRADGHRHQPEQPHAAWSTGTARCPRRPSSRTPRPASTATARRRPASRRLRGRGRAAVDRQAAQEPKRPPDTERYRANSAAASSGMITKVVSGMAMMFAPTPYRPDAMEMVEGERHQRDLDREAGGDDPEQCAQQSARSAPPRAAAADRAPSRSNGARRSRSPRRNSSGSSGPASASGRNSEHDQRAGGDQADADRVAPKRDAGEDQQRRDATSHRRHLHSGQQGVADARQQQRRAAATRTRLKRSASVSLKREQPQGQRASRRRPRRRCAAR